MASSTLDTSSLRTCWFAMGVLSSFAFSGKPHASAFNDLVQDSVELLVQLLNLRSCQIQLRMPSSQRLGQVDLAFLKIVIAGLSIYPAGGVESWSMQLSAGTIASGLAVGRTDFANPSHF